MKTPFPKPVFAAHSESDTTADIAGIESLEKVSDPNRFKFFRILKEDGVSHASLVLKDSIFAYRFTWEGPSLLILTMGVLPIVPRILS